MARKVINCVRLVEMVNWIIETNRQDLAEGKNISVRQIMAFRGEGVQTVVGFKGVRIKSNCHADGISFGIVAGFVSSLTKEGGCHIIGLH